MEILIGIVCLPLYVFLKIATGFMWLPFKIMLKIPIVMASFWYNVLFKNNKW